MFSNLNKRPNVNIFIHQYMTILLKWGIIKNTLHIYTYKKDLQKKNVIILVKLNEMCVCVCESTHKYITGRGHNLLIHRSERSDLQVIIICGQAL